MVLLAPVIERRLRNPGLAAYLPDDRAFVCLPQMKAICASVNFDRFIVLPRPTAPNRCAAKLEFSSNPRMWLPFHVKVGSRRASRCLGGMAARRRLALANLLRSMILFSASSTERCILAHASAPSVAHNFWISAVGGLRAFMIIVERKRLSPGLRC